VTAYDETGATTAWTPEDAMEGSVVIPPTPDLTSVPAYGPQVVNGLVTDAGGNPVSAARVSLYADLATRTKVFPPLLAESYTDAGGAYALQLRDDGVTDAVLSNSGGWMNFTMVVRGPGVETTTFFTRQYDPAQGAWLDENGMAPDAEPVTLTTSGPLGGASRALSQHLCPPAPPQLVATATGWATLGELHTWTTETGSFTYTKSSSTQISIAVSPDLNGPWSLSGSATLSGSSSSFWQTWPTAGPSFAKLAQGSEQSGKYKTPRTICTPQTFKIQPMKFLGGTNWASQFGLSIPDGHCPDKITPNSVLMVSGSAWGRSNGQGHSYSGGLSVFGIGLTTSSSWSSSTTTNWSTKNTGTPPGKFLAVCGDGTGGVWYSAQRIYMGPWYAK
jgi:hypothetical protein